GPLVVDDVDEERVVGPDDLLVVTGADHAGDLLAGRSDVGEGDLRFFAGLALDRGQAAVGLLLVHPHEGGDLVLLWDRAAGGRRQQHDGERHREGGGTSSHRALPQYPARVPDTLSKRA